MRLRRQNTDDPRVEHDLDVLAGAYASGEEPAQPADDADDPAAVPRKKGWRRDNASDPRVLADLDLLAAHDAGTLPPPEPVEGAGDPMQDPFVRRFIGGAEHVRGHAKYYGALVAWLLLMFVLVPIVTHDDGKATASTDGGVTAAAAAVASPTTTTTAVQPTVVPAPVVPEVAAPTPTFDAPVASEPATAPPSDSTTVAPPTTTEAVSPYLTIARSGYASSSAGTPLEQEPADGALPVEAAGGQATKRSFVALQGSGTVLHLKVMDGAVGSGAVAACPLTTSDWKADRAQAMPGPAFDTTCANGTQLADGSWVFDLSQFGDRITGAGFALTPMAGTFSLAFSPSALPPA